MRAAALCLLFVLSCAVPSRDYTPDQIASETDFEELMYVQATVADPRFKLAKGLDAGKMSENDFEQFLDMGTRLQLTAKRIGEISRTDFGGFDKQLGSRAKSLEDFARALDGPNTIKAVRAVKKTCAACHAEYR